MRIFSRSSDKNAVKESAMDMELLPYGVSTTSAVQELMKSQDGRFELYAGATLALHQDTKAFLAVDMAKTNDASEELRQTYLDSKRTHVFGKYVDRLESALKLMHKFDNENMDFFCGGHQANSDKGLANRVAAQANMLAARTWWITMISPFNRELILSKDTIWIAISTIRQEILLDKATIFTGAYFEGIRCLDMNIDFWPKPG